MTDAPAPTVWPCLSYEDAPAAIAFLTALGFTETLVVPGEGGREIAHAELVWPEGGAVMLGSAVPDQGPFAARPTGAGSTYVVTADPAAALERATALGATVVRPMQDEDYGSTGFSIADPEGNHWSFGTYCGEPA
jgi:uncharacterized glyoxalase superfamily protein PhnB